MATQLLPDAAPLTAHPFVRLARTRFGHAAQLVTLGALHYAALKIPNLPHAQLAFGDGVAVAGVVVLGVWAAPAILISGLLHFLGSTPTSLALYFAGGEALTAVVAGVGLRLARWNDPAFESIRDVIWFIGLTAIMAPLAYIVSAPLVQILTANTYQMAGSFSFLLYLRSLMGILLVAPVLLTWLAARPQYRATAGWLELGALATAMLTVAVFSPSLTGIAYLPLFLLLCWAGLRAGARGTTLASLGIFVITAYLTR
ncbi:MAG TPA: MASE1 domain-containing protein, partial [Gemmatimonadales bacterium]|nr:MASE1 domain-containing protein [Gemmatimonadales bacterium]